MEEEVCQAFSEMLLRSDVEDVDADDGEDPQLCSDYVKDIYWYLRKLEVCTHQKEQGLCSALPVVEEHWAV